MKSIPHTIEAAMALGELDEDEAYFILRIAGHLGYDKAQKRMLSPVSRLRRWLIWIGGWEVPSLIQWDQGEPAWKIKGRDPFPISLFGHRISIFSDWISISLKELQGEIVIKSTGEVYFWQDYTPYDSRHIFIRPQWS